MSHYLMRWKFKEQSIKAMTETPQHRGTQARQLVEGFGGKMPQYFFSFGDYDGLAIVEFPDNISAAACSMRATASGGFLRFETHPLMTAQEAQQAMERVKTGSVAYQSPPEVASR